MPAPAPGSAGAPSLQVLCALAPALAWSPDGGRLAYRAEDGMAGVLDLSAAAPAAGSPGLGMAIAMAFAPQGGRLALLDPSLPGRMT